MAEKASAPPTAARYVKAEYEGGVKVKTQTDKTLCWITGIALLPGDKLVLADRINNKIKLVDFEEEDEVVSELGASTPWDVARIADNQVAVTLENDRAIMFVKVTSSLKEERKMNVGGSCTAIAHNNGKLIVAYSGPVKIEIMGLDGTVEKTIDCSKLFECPSHVALSPAHDAMYVTDPISHSVTRLSLGGDVEAVYEEDEETVEEHDEEDDEDEDEEEDEEQGVERKKARLRRPRGVVVDQQGGVIVCGEGSHKIHLLSADLTTIKVMAKRVMYPNSVSLCHDEGWLYVSGYQNNNVDMYQLS